MKSMHTAIAMVAVVGAISGDVSPVRSSEPLGQQGDGSPLARQLPQATSDGVLPRAEPGVLANSREPRDLDASADREIRRAIVRIINGSLTKGGLEDVVGYLAKADRQRVSKVADATHQDLDTRIVAFRKSFRARYNQDFDFRPEHLKNYLLTKTGENRTVAQVVLGPLPAKAKMGDPPADGLREILPPKGNAAAPGDVASSTTRKNRPFIIATLPITLVFVNEGNVLMAWRIDLPDALDGHRLKESLITVASQLEDAKTDWPDEIAEVYQMVASQLFSALTQAAIASEK